MDTGSDKPLIEMPVDKNLPSFKGKTIEDHVQAFQMHASSAQAHQWMVTSISASLEKKHGEGSVKEFAKEVNKSERWVHRLAVGFRVWQKRQRSVILDFTHHLIIAEAFEQKIIADPVAVLEYAEIHNLSTRKLEDHIATMKNELDKAPEELSPEVKKEPGREAPEKEYIDFNVHKETYEAWVNFLFQDGCWVSKARSNLDPNHFTGLVSDKTKGFLPRRKLESMFLLFPVTRDYHTERRDSFHQIGEQAFIEQHFSSRERLISRVLKRAFQFMNKQGLEIERLRTEVSSEKPNG